MAKKQIATFLGPNQGLSIAQEFAYAYSGTFEASSASVDMLSFHTGKEIIKGEFTFNGQVRYISGSAGGDSVFELQLNGLTVGIYKTDTANSDMPNQLFQRVILPPLTHVLVKCISGEDTATELLTTTFSGRVYA